MTQLNGDEQTKHLHLAAHPGICVKGLAECLDQDWHGQNEHVWVDVQAPTPEQVEDLKRHFAFNRLALDDALETDHWSRFERYPEHYFLIFRTLAEPERLTDRTEEIDIFWYPEKKALVTFHHEKVDYLDATWKETDSYAGRTPEDLIYTLLQRGTDTFFAFLDELEDRSETLEQRLFESQKGHRRFSKPGVDEEPRYGEIFALRRTMIAARKQVSGTRETVALFARHAADVSPVGGQYLRDVADHLARVYGGLDTARDLLNGLLEVYLGVENQRLNEVIRTLTTVSTIFLPLTFLAGVWDEFRLGPRVRLAARLPLRLELLYRRQRAAPVVLQTQALVVTFS